MNYVFRIGSFVTIETYGELFFSYFQTLQGLQPYYQKQLYPADKLNELGIELPSELGNKSSAD